MKLEHVDGKDKGDILLFALSTCGWCKKTRMLLESEEVAYDYIYVDLTEGEEKKEAIDELSKYNEEQSFPTLILNSGEAVVKGFEEDQIKEALSL